jgi:hypothetical protein
MAQRSAYLSSYPNKPVLRDYGWDRAILMAYHGPFRMYWLVAACAVNGEGALHVPRCRRVHGGKCKSQKKEMKRFHVHAIYI